MCGGGASGYQEDDAFDRAGIGLVYQNYSQTKYQQVGNAEFAGGLSIIDALMNIGQSSVSKMLRKDRTDVD